MSSNKPLLGALISFFFPGLGLLLSEENKSKGVLIFVIAMLADFTCWTLATLLAICILPIILYFAPILIHFLAALHSHDVLIKEEKGGKPVIFS